MLGRWVSDSHQEWCGPPGPFLSGLYSLVKENFKPNNRLLIGPTKGWPDRLPTHDQLHYGLAFATILPLLDALSPPRVPWHLLCCLGHGGESCCSQREETIQDLMMEISMYGGNRWEFCLMGRDWNIPFLDYCKKWSRLKGKDPACSAIFTCPQFSSPLLHRWKITASLMEINPQISTVWHQ